MSPSQVILLFMMMVYSFFFNLLVSPLGISFRCKVGSCSFAPACLNSSNLFFYAFFPSQTCPQSSMADN